VLGRVVASVIRRLVATNRLPIATTEPKELLLLMQLTSETTEVAESENRTGGKPCK